jgi:signal transduction histidine kinase
VPTKAGRCAEGSAAQSCGAPPATQTEAINLVRVGAPGQSDRRNAKAKEVVQSVSRNTIKRAEQRSSSRSYVEISAAGKKEAPAVDGATSEGGRTVATAEASNTAKGEAGLAADAAVLREGEAAKINVDKQLSVSTETADDVAVTDALSPPTDRKIGTKQHEQRLTQVLLNLVGNAIKFTDAGEVRIAAGAANGHFTVSVSDTGPGIPAEECKHIFEKFRQVDSSNTRGKGGTGLGLTIAREIVEMHGGRI